MKELAKLSREVSNTTATEDREEPVEEEKEGQRKITEFLLVENDDEEDDDSLSTQELIIDARARKANRNRKLECVHCKFETWSKTLLTKHVERSHEQDIHSETESSLGSDIVQDEPATVQVRDRKQCEDCGFRTTSDDVLTKHINIKHKNKPTTAKNGSKRLPCGVCKKYFYKKTNLLEHRRTTHGVENAENSIRGDNGGSIINEVQ